MKTATHSAPVRLAPAVYAALGAALSYYGLSPLYARPALLGAALPVFGLLLVTAAAFFRVLASLPQGGAAPGAERRVRARRARALCAALFASGAALGAQTRGKAAREAVLAPGLPAEAVTAISGRLLDDPRALGGDAFEAEASRGMARVELTEALGRRGTRTSARGQVTVFFPAGAIPRLKAFGRGSRVYIEGRFAESALGGLLFRAQSAHVVKAAPTLEQLRTGARLAVSERFAGARERPWGGLSLALLLGIKDNLDTALAAQYRTAGCSYILALSGMHLAIVSAAIAFLLKRPLGLKAATLLGALFIALYTALVGAMPSLERAAIMYLLGAAAIFFALPAKPFTLLALAFVIQICREPLSGDSVSFLLSYLALAGILTIGKTLNGLFRGILPSPLASPLSASLGAFLATCGLTAAIFGELRPAGALSGLLIVPLTTAFMTGSMIYLACAFTLPALCGPLALPLQSLYRLLDLTSRLAGSAPCLRTPISAPWIIASLALPLLLAALWQARLAAQTAPLTALESSRNPKASPLGGH